MGRLTLDVFFRIATEAIGHLTDRQLDDFIQYLIFHSYKRGIRDKSWFHFVKPLFTEKNGTRVNEHLFPFLLDTRHKRREAKKADSSTQATE